MSYLEIAKRTKALADSYCNEHGLDQFKVRWSCLPSPLVEEILNEREHSAWLISYYKHTLSVMWDVLWGEKNNYEKVTILVGMIDSMLAISSDTRGVE